MQDTVSGITELQRWLRHDAPNPNPNPQRVYNLKSILQIESDR